MHKVLAILAVASVIMPAKPEAQEAIMPETYVFKKAKGVELEADVYLPSLDGKGLPVIVYLHGGALIFGRRQGQPRSPLREKLLAAGYAVVSIDYRLAPQTKAEEIAKDVEDACKWVRSEGPELFHIDPARVVVMGGSAGGYLTLLIGGRLERSLRALVSFSGYGDLLWYNKARIEQLPESIPPYEGKGEMNFYQYCRKYGVWIKEVTGLDYNADAEKLKRLRPVENVTKNYPATLLVHSESDSDVPYEQALKMKEVLDSNGIVNELMTVQSGHSSVMLKKYPEIADKVLKFLDRIMGEKSE